MKQTPTEEQLFLQSALQLAAQYGIVIKFGHDNVMNFVGDEQTCMACIEKLASMFPNSVHSDMA